MGIYAMQCKETGLIKIGKSKDPIKRLKSIEKTIGNGIDLLGFNSTIPHDFHVHWQLRGSHCVGEWFYPTASVLRYVKKYLTTNKQALLELKASDKYDSFCNCELDWSECKFYYTSYRLDGDIADIKPQFKLDTFKLKTLEGFNPPKYSHKYRPQTKESRPTPVSMDGKPNPILGF